jgi:lysophospholipase L1-like esterase
LSALTAAGIAWAVVYQPEGDAESQPSPGPSAPVKAVFIGDSYTAGDGAPSEADGFAALAGAELGWDTTILAVGGSGYLAEGAGTTFGQRLAEIRRVDPGVVVVAGSRNDTSMPGDVAHAAATTFAAIQRVAPDAELVVIGVMWPGPDVPAEANVTNDEIHRASDASGVAFIDPLALGWLRQSDGFMASDGVHPNAEGHQVLALLAASEIERALG